MSLLSNIARLQVLGRHELAALWLTGPSAKQFANQLGGMRHWVTDERIGTSLRLTVSEVLLAFDPTHWWPEALRALATPFADPLRFCPVCLEQGYHTHLFQLPWWQRCPVHDLDLLSTCPGCGGSLAGLGLRAPPKYALYCSRCDRDFVDTGALVDAARSPIVERWHTIVGAHRVWASAVSNAFVVAPTLVTPYCEIAAQSVIEWIKASGVPWPRELRRFVSELSTCLGGLRVRVAAPKDEDVDALKRLSATIADSTTPDVEDLQVFPAVNRTLGKSLARTERRLQRISSADFPRLARAHRFRHPQKLNDSQVSALEEVEESEIALMRDRGYRLRCAELDLTENHWLAVVGRRRDHLIGLAAFRLLCHVRSALADFESTTARSAARDVLEWWYAHLMTVGLIDGTVAAIHLVAFPRSGTMELPGWPPVDLGRHPPGHSWVLAATRRKEELVAHLESMPLAATIRSDTERVGELQRNVGSRLLTFQQFSAEPAANRVR
ncbi:MAG: hypothetical protein E6Q50_09315 [Lysobacter sp.]|nr:MAG: hypothetical protein E6Q50_09315 [Lysobacter sp.]